MRGTLTARRKKRNPDSRDAVLEKELHAVLDEKARVDDHGRQLDLLRQENESLAHAYADLMRRTDKLERHVFKMMVSKERES